MWTFIILNYLWLAENTGSGAEQRECERSLLTVDRNPEGV